MLKLHLSFSVEDRVIGKPYYGYCHTTLLTLLLISIFAACLILWK